MGYSGKIMSSLSTSLKNSYQRYLHPYEEWVKQAKPGLQALDSDCNNLASGGLLPSQGVPKHRVTTSPGSPAQGLYALNTISTDTDDTDRDTVMGDDTPKGTPAPLVSSFTPIKASGFTAVNCLSSSFTSVNPTSNGVKKEVENGYLTPARRSDGTVSTKNTPELKGGTPLKRAHNVESTENLSMANGDDSELGERRSKRLKKGGALSVQRCDTAYFLGVEAAPTVAGSHMTLHRPQTSQRAGGQRSKAKPGEVHFHNICVTD